jgi:hypothetical protein
MRKLPDIDIDFADREDILSKLKHIPATLTDGKKHNTGAYFIDIPVDPMTGLASLDFEEAEKRGYFKVDFLNVNVYNGIKDEKHMNTLLAKEPNWQRLWTDKEFCEKVIHVNNHFELLGHLKPDSMVRMAMFLAVMRPGKANLRNYDWKAIARTVWDKPADGSYYFKKAHAVAYAHLVALHINLLEEE